MSWGAKRCVGVMLRRFRRGQFGGSNGAERANAGHYSRLLFSIPNYLCYLGYTEPKLFITLK